MATLAGVKLNESCVQTSQKSYENEKKFFVKLGFVRDFRILENFCWWTLNFKAT